MRAANIEVKVRRPAAMGITSHQNAPPHYQRAAN
jgi:hypothetical protein